MSYEHHHDIECQNQEDDYKHKETQAKSLTLGVGPAMISPPVNKTLMGTPIVHSS
jgi:lysine/ornithine N-monooxygenase